MAANASPAIGAMANRTGRPRLSKSAVRQAIVHLALLPPLVIIMVPLVWMVSMSLSDLGSVFSWPIRWIPDPVLWKNYPEALSLQPFGLYFRNTAFVAILRIQGQLLSSSLVAFAFARMRWRARDRLFILVLATMMLPGQVTMIPQFVLFRYLGWINTYWPLIAPAYFGSPFFIFLLRQFFMTISRELDDAARIDGATSFQIYYRVLLPLCRPALIAVAIFEFQSSWNWFLEPLIYLNSRSKWLLSLGLKSFLGEYMQWWNLMMAASVVVMIPVIVLFFVGQKYFIQGVVFTGVKQ